MDRVLENSLIWSTQIIHENMSNKLCTCDGVFSSYQCSTTKIIHLQKEGPGGITDLRIEIPPDFNSTLFYPHPDGKSVGFSFFTSKGRIVRIYDSADGKLLFESDPSYFPDINRQECDLFVEYLNDGSFLISYGSDYSLVYKNYQFQGVLIHGANFEVPSLQPFPILSRKLKVLTNYMLKSLSASYMEGYNYWLRAPVMSGGSDNKYSKILESDPYCIKYIGNLSPGPGGWRGRKVIKHTVTVEEQGIISDPKLDRRLLEYRELFSSEILNELFPSCINVVTTKELIVLRVNNIVGIGVHDNIIVVLDRRTLHRSSYSHRSIIGITGILSIKASGRRVAVSRLEEKSNKILNIYRPVILWSPLHHSTFIKEWREFFTQIFMSLYLYTSLPREIVVYIVSLMDELSEDI